MLRAKVKTWGVWDWPLLDIIGILLGLVGVCVEILLPAGLVGYFLFSVESNPKINYHKTNILLVVLNAIGVYGLYRMSRVTYEISKTHYSNYGDYTEHIVNPLWSWNHLWVFFRPLIFLIAGIIALSIVLIVGYYLFKVLGLFFTFLGEQIQKFFTTITSMMGTHTSIKQKKNIMATCKYCGQNSGLFSYLCKLIVDK